MQLHVELKIFSWISVQITVGMEEVKVKRADLGHCSFIVNYRTLLWVSASNTVHMDVQT